MPVNNVPKLKVTVPGSTSGSVQGSPDAEDGRTKGKDVQTLTQLAWPLAAAWAGAGWHGLRHIMALKIMTECGLRKRDATSIH